MDLVVVVNRIVAVWIVFIVGMFLWLCRGDVIMTVGPSPTRLFFNLVIDNYTKYALFMLFVIVNQTISNLGMIVTSGFQYTKIQNDAYRHLEYTRGFVHTTITAWYIFIELNGTLGVRFNLMQIDVLLVIWLIPVVVQNLVAKYHLDRKASIAAEDPTRFAPRELQPVDNLQFV